jgi:hypothetical protein
LKVSAAGPGSAVKVSAAHVEAARGNQSDAQIRPVNPWLNQSPFDPLQNLKDNELELASFWNQKQYGRVILDRLLGYASLGLSNVMPLSNKWTDWLVHSATQARKKYRPPIA